MRLGDLVVSIRNGRELVNGWVVMQHGRTYKIEIRNQNRLRGDAKVTIDGNHIGTWRVYGHGSLVLERPSNDKGRFTFYKSDSQEAEKVKTTDDPNLQGLVTVEFTWEKDLRPLEAAKTTWADSERVYPTFGATGQSVSGGTAQTMGTPVTSNYTGGVTGLSGQSDQSFVPADVLDLDHSSTVTINLRLVSTSASRMVYVEEGERETPVPPPPDSPRPLQEE